MTTQSKLKDDVAAPVNGYQRRRLETRRQLLQAGRALFVEKAVEQVSIESITERAGVAKGSFYNHFESREARGRFVFCTLLSDPATCRLLLQGGQPLQGGAIDRVMRMVLGDTLAIGLSMGSLSHLDPEIVYAAYFGAVTQTIAHLLTCEDDIDVAAAADEVTALCFAVLGLAPYMPPAGQGEQVA